MSTEEGLPQVSTLSQTMFNVINDTPKKRRKKLALYADGAAILVESLNIDLATKYTQKHLDVLTDYFHKRKIKINTNKTETIYLTKKLSAATTKQRKIIEDQT